MRTLGIALLLAVVALAQPLRAQQPTTNNVVIVMPQAQANHMLAYLQRGGSYLEGQNIADELLAGVNLGSSYVAGVNAEKTQPAHKRVCGNFKR